MNGNVSRCFWTLMLPLSLAAGSATAASPFSTPPPLFSDGLQGRSVFYVTGVVASIGGLETAFTCTSLEATKNIDIGVEVFNFNTTLQNDISAGNGVRLNIVPGSTRTITTADIAALDEDDIMTGVTADQGSARIVSTSPRILCTAGLFDKTNSPPTSMVQLPVFKGTVQKGN